MARWTAEKRATLDALADEFLAHYRRGRTIIAIDGVDGVGKTVFADAFAERLGRSGHGVVRASVDDYEDAIDEELLRRVLVEPFRLGGSAAFVTAAFDVAADRPIEPVWRTAPADATLVIDGVFLGKPSLRGLWNSRVWLEAEPDVVRARLLARDGERSLAPRYAGGQALYRAEANPRARASAIVDVTDPDRPRRVFADAC
jgi:uridine kinase